MSDPIKLGVEHVVSDNELASYKGPKNIMINEFKRAMAHSLFQQVHATVGTAGYTLRVAPMVSTSINEHQTRYSIAATLTID